MTLPVPPPALGRLLEHQGFVERLARQLCLDESSAQDLQQETWLVALRNPPRHEASPKGWLATVMRNLHFRRRKQELARATQETRGFERSERSVLTPDEEVAADQARTRMGIALGRLPDHYREAVRLRFEEGLPPREMGKRLGIEAEQARARVRRAVTMLRSDLDQEGERRDWLAGMFLLAKPNRSPVPETAAAPAFLVLVLGAAASLLFWLTRGAEAQDLPSIGGESVASHSPAMMMAGERRAERAEETSPDVVPVAIEEPLEDDSFVRISGIVLRDGEPVPRAKIVITNPDDWTVKRHGWAEDDGRFDLEGLPRGAWLGAAHIKSRSQLVWLDGPIDGSSIELHLDIQTTLFQGQVLEPDGRPAVGARFEMLGEGTLFAMFEADGFRKRGCLPNSVGTNHQGRYTLRYDGRGIRHRLRVTSLEGQWVGRLRGDDVIRLAEFGEASAPEEESSREEVLIEGEVDPGLEYILFEAAKTDLEVIRVGTDGRYSAEVPAVPGTLLKWPSGRPPLPFAYTDGTGRVEPIAEENEPSGEVELLIHGDLDFKGSVMYLEFMHPNSALVVQLEEFPELEDSDEAYRLEVKGLAPGTWRVTHRSKFHIREQHLVRVEPGKSQRVEFRPEGGQVVRFVIEADRALTCQERLGLSIWDEQGTLLCEEPVWMPTGEVQVVIHRLLPPGNNRIRFDGEYGAVGEVVVTVDAFPQDPDTYIRVPLVLKRPHSEHDSTAVKAE